jgi:hypothetical protein
LETSPNTTMIYVDINDNHVYYNYKKKSMTTNYPTLVSLVGWCLQIFVIVGWFLQIIVKIFFLVFSQNGFHVNLMFRVLELIYIICDCFIMVDECLKK